MNDLTCICPPGLVGHYADCPVARLVEALRTPKFRDALQAVFDAPGEWGPAQGYYGEHVYEFRERLIFELVTRR